MPVQKFGRINLMTQKVIFGVLAVCCMRCVHWTHPSKQQICLACIKRLLVVHSLPCHLSILMLLHKWLKAYSNKYHHLDLTVLKFYQWATHKIIFLTLLRVSNKDSRNTKNKCWTQLSCPETWVKYLTDYQNPSITSKNQP